MKYLIFIFSKTRLKSYSKDNRWFVHMNKQCRILSNTQCIWSSEILKKLKSLKSRFKRESNLKNIADINRNFLSKFYLVFNLKTLKVNILKRFMIKIVKFYVLQNTLIN